jgi:hypothetical protein
VTPPAGKPRKCKHCRQPLAAEGDGYGEQVHADTGKYLCDQAPGARACAAV